MIRCIAWINPFIKRHQDCILALDSLIPRRLHISVRTQCFLDISHTSILRFELYGFEILDILPIMEHIANGDQAFMNFIGLA